MQIKKLKIILSFQSFNFFFLDKSEYHLSAHPISTELKIKNF